MSAKMKETFTKRLRRASGVEFSRINCASSSSVGELSDASEVLTASAPGGVVLAVESRCALEGATTWAPEASTFVTSEPEDAEDGAPAEEAAAAGASELLIFR